MSAGVCVSGGVRLERFRENKHQSNVEAVKSEKRRGSSDTKRQSALSKERLRNLIRLQIGERCILFARTTLKKIIIMR